MTGTTISIGEIVMGNGMRDADVSHAHTMIAADAETLASGIPAFGTFFTSTTSP